MYILFLALCFLLFVLVVFAFSSSVTVHHFYIKFVLIQSWEWDYQPCSTSKLSGCEKEDILIIVPQFFILLPWLLFDSYFRENFRHTWSWSHPEYKRLFADWAQDDQFHFEIFQRLFFFFFIGCSIFPHLGSYNYIYLV